MQQDQAGSNSNSMPVDVSLSICFAWCNSDGSTPHFNSVYWKTQCSMGQTLSRSANSLVCDSSSSQARVRGFANATFAEHARCIIDALDRSFFSCLKIWAIPRPRAPGELTAKHKRWLYASSLGLRRNFFVGLHACPHLAASSGPKLTVLFESRRGYRCTQCSKMTSAMWIASPLLSPRSITAHGHRFFKPDCQETHHRRCCWTNSKRAFIFSD